MFMKMVRNGERLGTSNPEGTVHVHALKTKEQLYLFKVQKRIKLRKSIRCLSFLLNRSIIEKGSSGKL